MESLADALRYVTALLALALAVVTVVRIRRGGDARRWGAAAFVALAVVLLESTFGGEGSSGWAGKVLIGVLLAFPYALLRFTASLGAVRPRVVKLSTLATVAILVTTLALPSRGAGDARPAWFAVYAGVVVVFWAALSLLTIAGLWREGVGQPTLARRRVRFMSVGTAGMAVLILLAPLGLNDGAGRLTVEALLLLSLVAFGIGFAPPQFVRLAWQQPEQAELRLATERLVSAVTVSDVVDTLMPHLPRIVGGSGAALYDERGELVSGVGEVPPLPTAGQAVQILPLSPPFRALVVATSPLTPFFGRA